MDRFRLVSDYKPSGDQPESRITLASSKHFSNNDVYFMEVVSDKIVINDNHNGVLILDSNLNVIKRIKLIADLTIETSFIKEQEIVLYCCENRCLIHIDIDSYSYKIFSLNTDLEDAIFHPLYEWIGNDLILLAEYGKSLVHVNLLDNVVQVIQKDKIDRLHFSIYETWNKLKGSVIHKVYPQRYEAVVETDNVIKLINYKNGAESILKIDYFETAPHYFHDIEATATCVAQISEKAISVLYGDKKFLLYPDYENGSFFRGKFISIDKAAYLLLLSGNDSSLEKSTVEKYVLC